LHVIAPEKKIKIEEKIIIEKLDERDILKKDNNLSKKNKLMFIQKEKERKREEREKKKELKSKKKTDNNLEEVSSVKRKRGRPRKVVVSENNII
jgi:hypothetical protein